MSSFEAAAGSLMVTPIAAPFITAPGAGAPLDQPGNLLGKSLPETQPRVWTSKGSGFFISADGYAVTKRHVTANSESVEVITDDRKSYRANVVAVVPPTDIALLKVDGGNGFAHVEFADKAPRIGDRIFAVGNPFGLGGTVTSGIASARERSIASVRRQQHRYVAPRQVLPLSRIAEVTSSSNI